ncbi:MAG: glycosyltransferase 87 family protein [Cuniculiplasma sp.]
MNTSENEKQINHLRYFVFGLAFISIPFISINYTSYLDYAAIINGILLVIIGVTLFIFLISKIRETKFFKNLPYFGLALSILQLFFVIATLYPNALTDEIIIQTYAAKVFLEGKDPYINSNMSGVFNSIHPFPIYVTPGLNGKLVEVLLYPGMSVIAFLPVAYFHLPDYTTLFIFSAINFLAIFLYIRKNKMEQVLPYFSIIVLLTIYTFGLSIGGSTDILWIFFLVMAYIYRDRPWLSGIFYGLSLSSKQLAIVTFPFLAFMIFMNKDKSYKESLKFVLFAGFSFLISNLPFIIMQPYDWLRNIVEAEFQPVLGIGIGFSELSFTGLINVPSSVFALLFLAAISLTFLFYVKYYKQLKYALFVLPMIMFLFNYRVLLGYIVDWALLIIISYSDYVREKDMIPPLLEDIRVPSINKPIKFKNLGNYLHKNITFAIIIIIILSMTTGGAIYLSGHANDTDIYRVNSVTNMTDPLCIPGYISSMTVNLTYEPTLGLNVTSPIYFRIIPSTETGGNYNGLLWYSNNVIKPGVNHVQAYPESYAYLLHQGIPFNIQAYYNYESNFIKLRTPIIKQMGIANYEMEYPTNEPTSPFPCWKVSSTANTGNRFNYVLNNGTGNNGNGFNLSLSRGTNTSEYNIISLKNDNINLTYLKSVNDVLHFNYTYNGSGSYFTGKSMKNFLGVQITLDSTYSVYYGMNKTAYSDRIYSYGTNYVIIERQGIINFTQVYNIAKSLNLNPTLVTLSYEAFSYSNRGQSLIIQNISLT